MDDLRHAFATLFALAPAPSPRWPIGLQAGLAMAIPIAVMTMVGVPEVGYQAATGAFAALYATHLAPIERMRVLPMIGAALLGAGILGALAAGSTPTMLVGLAVVTIGGAAAVFGWGIGAPGPVFVVLVFGVSAYIVESGADAAAYVASLAGGIAFALLLASAPLALRSHRSAPSRSLREILAARMPSTDVRTLLLRVAAVTLVGVSLGAVLDPARAYWIVGSAVAVVGVATSRRAPIARGIHRMIGTTIGATVYLMLQPFAPSGVWLALLLGALQFTIELVVVRNYALALIFITPLVLLLTGAATGLLEATVAWERVLDTLVGSALGVASGFLRMPHSARGD